MKKNITLFIFIFSAFLGLSQGSYPVWDKDYAWGGDQDDYLMDIHQNKKDYSILSAGHTYTSGNQDFSGLNKGDADFWVLKSDTGGVVLYEKSFGGDSTDQLAGIIPTGDDGYLLAGSSASGMSGEKSQSSKGGYDFWIVKIDENGNKQWDKSIGGSDDDYLTCAVADGNGGYYLGGYSFSNAGEDKSDNSYGDEDFWMVKINASGTVIWDVSFGGDTTDILTNVQFGSDQVWLGGYSISDSSGNKTEDSYGGFDYWIVSIDDTGNKNWDKNFGGSEDDFLEEIRPLKHSEGFWIAGTTNSKSTGNKSSGGYNNGDFWILNVDDSAIVKFDRTFGSNGSETLKDMEISPEGSAIIAGYSNGSGGSKISGNNGGFDNWIIKVDTNGVKFWDYNYGGAEDDTLQAIFIKCDRGILAGGYSESSISGDRTHLNKGVNDYWVYELSVPTHPWFRVSDVCSGVPLSFFDESDVWPDKWLWDFDDPTSAQNTSEDQHPIHTYSQAGLYMVSMMIKEGCQNDTTLTREVRVWDNTVLGNVDLGRDFSICGQSNLEIYNEDINAPDRVTYAWSTGETTESIFIENKGQYTLTVTDQHCSAADSVLVDTCPDFRIPDAFSPNSDDLNDVFKVWGVGLYEFDLLIFNRWGQLIYRSHDQEEGWDGTVNGRDVQADVYVYKLIYKGLGLSRKEKVGIIALVR
jgi:gliding motility-associated-like protein|tara:strand:+ start:9608 stop:11680 length:2073 start_codon:yes stop_codon:yes gene_type:complete